MSHQIVKRFAKILYIFGIDRIISMISHCESGLFNKAFNKDADIYKWIRTKWLIKDDLSVEASLA